MGLPARQTDDEGPAATALPLRPEPEPLDGYALEAQPAPGAEEGAASEIEPGRALALADFAPPPLRLAERMIRLAYRLGVPGAMLTRAMGRKSRLRLLATVTNTIPGDRAAGMALRTGHFLVHGARTPVAQVDFAGAARMTPPLERMVHGFSWLVDLEAAAPREQVAPIAEEILEGWLRANADIPKRPGKGPAWTVGNAAERLLNWLVHAPLVLSGDKAMRSRMLGQIAGTARWLDRNVDKAEDRLAAVAGWCAVVAAGLLLPDGRPRRLYGEAGLARALGELVGDDGGVLSRSPLAQIEAIALMVRLRCCYQATRRDMPESFESVVTAMVPPLLAMLHSDGSLGSWHGSWALGAAEVRAIVDASVVRTRPLRDVRQWGFQRDTAQKSVLVWDAAPPPVPRHARHACASTLAFEFSHAAHRIVVNCGGAQCAGGQVPVRLEQALRASAAHSTLVLDDSNSTAVLIGGKIGGGVSQVSFDRRVVAPEAGRRGFTRLEASHDGYAARFGLTHRRVMALRDDGEALEGEDMLLPAGRKGKRGKIGFAVRFHLGADVEVVEGDDARTLGLALPDGSAWLFRARPGDMGGELAVEESLWVDEQARPRATRQIVVQGLVSRGGGSFGWSFSRIA